MPRRPSRTSTAAGRSSRGGAYDLVHQELDETEALLQRCIALAQQQDDAGLRSDIAELRTQFTLLSEMQRLTLRNIL